MSGHWRLLDAKDVRRAWGTRQNCELELVELLPTNAAETDTSHRYVILLHGLMRSHHSMKSLGTKLDSEDCGSVIRFSYASTRSSISDHAAALQEVLAGLPEDAEIAFVGHSMGNIVVRHLMCLSIAQHSAPYINTVGRYFLSVHIDAKRYGHGEFGFEIFNETFNALDNRLRN